MSELRREVSGIKLIIFSLGCDQFVMSTSFNNASLLHYHDTVGVFDSGETMGDDEGGPSFHQGVHTCLHQFFGTGINGGGSLIQDQGRRIGHCRAGDGEKLSLSLA